MQAPGGSIGAAASWRFLADLDTGCPLDALPHPLRLTLAETGKPAIRHRLLAQAWLRHLIATPLGVDASALLMDRTRHGKPFLPDHPGMYFSLSHSRGAALVAWSDLPIGVDLEAKDRQVGSPLAGRILHPREWAAYSALPKADQSHWLLRAWVRKEAVAKADGRGIAMGLASIDQCGAAVTTPPDRHWQLADLPLPPDWVGAMALATEPNPSRTCQEGNFLG